MATFETLEEIAARKGFGVEIQHQRKMALLDRVRKFCIGKRKAKEKINYLTDIVEAMDGHKSSESTAKYGFRSSDFSAVYAAVREAKRRDMLAVEYGITIGAPSAKVKEATQTSGAFVSAIEPGSPAEKAGMRANDAFHRVQGDWTLQDGSKGLCFIYSRFEKGADGKSSWNTYSIESPNVPENRYKMAAKVADVFSYENTAPEVARSKTLDDIVATIRPVSAVMDEYADLEDDSESNE